MTGRPTIFTPQLGAEICARLADGESLNRICASEQLPARSTVHGWLMDGNHTEFLDKYRRAREVQADGFVDDCHDLADDVKGSDRDDVAVAKLRIDTRLKLAALMAPKKYRPGVKNEIEAGDGLANQLAAALERVSQ